MAGLGLRVWPLFELEDVMYQGSEFQIHYSESDWAGLYHQGKLVYQGHEYQIHEKLTEMLGVVEVHDDAFMMGQQRKEGVAQTLDAVEDYKLRREDRREAASRLREEAAAMVAKAVELEKEAERS